jgi:hypothetical protein
MGGPQPGPGQVPQGYPAPGSPQPGPGQAPYGYPAPGYYPAPKGSNGIALAGAITSFIPVVGLVLSIIGRVRAKALGGAGKTAGTVGIILSLIFTVGGGYGLYKLGNSTAADPGCISAEAAARSMNSTLSSDESAIATAEQNGDSSALDTAKNKFLSDFQGLKAKVDSAAAESKHGNVKAAIQAMGDDLANFNTEFQAIFAGTSTDTATLTQTASKLQTDGDALDNLCGNVTNG